MALATEAGLEVSGEVVGQAADSVDVRVGLANHGQAAMTHVTADAELFGHVESRTLDAGIAVGGSSALVFSFPLASAQPGVHAVTLRLEYQFSDPSSHAELTRVQPAYVLLALGENPAPALKLMAPDAHMDSVGRWRVGLESSDGAPHRVRLRVVVPRTLRADPLDSLLSVPASGRVEKELLLFRVDAPWEGPQGALLVAETDGEPLTRTSVATAVVHVGREPGRMARLRVPLALVMALLFLAAALLEARRYLHPEA
jgi:hypothetical protein